MGPHTRRALLRAGGLVLGGLVTGCLGDNGDGDGDTDTDEPSARPEPTSTVTETVEPEEFPPPEPTSAAPKNPTAMPTRTDWPRLHADTGNTGHLDAQAVPDAPETYWQFFVQSSPPVVADGTLYTAEYGPTQALVARDAATGRLQWAREVERGGAMGVPTVAGDTLVLQSYGTLFGFDRASGDLRWDLDIGRGPPGSPVVVDGVAYLANGSFSTWPSEAFAVAVESGTERWRTDLGTGELRLRGSVAVDDGTVFVVDGDLVALDVETGTEEWRVAFDAPAETTPTAADGTVFVTDTDGTLHAVATADGTEQWTAGVGSPDRGVAAAVAGDELYVGTDTGLHALTTAGERRWRVDLTRAATPTVGREAVYVGERGVDDRSVYAIRRADGTERWQRRTEEQTISDVIDAGIRGPPTLVDGGVYVVAADGIRAFGR